MFNAEIISTDRGNFEVFKRGTGEPLAFTHLYSEFNEYGNLMSQILSEYYSVYIINLRGAGRSDDQTDEFTYSMDDAIRDTEAIRETLGIKEWTFSGHSTGGFLALKYAILFPNSLTKIIAGGLCASSKYMEHPDSIYCPENPNNEKMKEIFAKLRKSDTSKDERISLSKEWIMMSLYRKEAYYDMLKKKESGRTLMEKIDYFTEELENYNVRDELKISPVNAHIYCGRHDAQCPHIFSEEVAKLMPNATLSTFENSNHHPDIEEKSKFMKFISKTVSQ